MPAPNSKLKSEVATLLHMVKPLGDRLVYTAASELELENFERNFEIKLPIEVREWLKFCNGVDVNPGGVIGLSKIGKHFEWSPSWQKNAWIPLASDGCGDYYVLAASEMISTSRTHPVFFIDQCDYERPAYIVASGLWKFFRFLFEDEIITQESPPNLDVENEGWYERFLERLNDPNDKHYWPFKKEQVLQKDRFLNDYEGNTPFPWDVDEEQGI